MESQTTDDSPILWNVTAIVVGSVYLALALGTAATRQPWCDEAWFASPAANLLESGTMGTSFIDTHDPIHKDISKYTYWQPPLYFLVQAVWYSLVGFSLFSMRALSTFWGLVLLISWLAIVRLLTENRWLALLTVALIAVDYQFLANASDGRMDTMCAALAFAGYAFYLALREHRLGSALLVSHTLVVASGLSHPNGILAFAGLVFLSLYLDRTRLRLRSILFAVIPYMVGGLAWGWYIAKNPSAFFSQFGGNMSGRLYGLGSLWSGFKLELTDRYLAAFGVGETTSPIATLKLLVLGAYVAGWVGLMWEAQTAKRSAAVPAARNFRALVWLTTLYFLVMSVLIGNKSVSYLVHTVPLLAACLAVWAGLLWVRRSVPVWTISASLVFLFLLQLGGAGRRVLQDPYHKSYLPAVQFLKAALREADAITGSAELAFALGFRVNLADDPRLGYYTGKTPSLIVVEPRYKAWFERWRKEEPEVYRYVIQLLDEGYRQVYNNSFYQILERKK